MSVLISCTLMGRCRGTVCDPAWTLLAPMTMELQGCGAGRRHRHRDTDTDTDTNETHKHNSTNSKYRCCKTKNQEQKSQETESFKFIINVMDLEVFGPKRRPNTFEYLIFGRRGGRTENWAPLPRVFHNTNESGSMRHECETASVMSALVRSMA